MDAVHIVRPGRLKISAVKEKSFRLRKGEALVEVRAVSLCGSDYSLFDGKYKGPHSYPIRFGHEWSGRVVSTGKGVTSVKRGDRVTGDCSRWCGRCANCARDKNVCRNIEKFGITIDGFSQQLVRVPEKYLYRAPSRIPYDVLALTECFSVALHAIHKLGKKPKEPPSGRTLVLGCGPIGAAVYTLLKRSFGWKRVDLYDVIPERSACLNDIFPYGSKEKAPDAAKARRGKECDDLHGSDKYALIFEATGSPQGLRAATGLAKAMGTIVDLSISAPAALDLKNITLKALTVIGSIGGTGEFPEVIRFFSKNSPLISRFITAKFFYRDAAKAFKEGRNKRKNLKVQILFGGA